MHIYDGPIVTCDYQPSFILAENTHRMTPLLYKTRFWGTFQNKVYLFTK